MLNLSRHFLSHPTELLESLLGSLALAWGLHLLLPLDTFHSSVAYLAMHEVAPEWAWGLATAVLGGAQIATSRFGTLRARQRAATISSAVWGFIATAFFVGSPASTAVATYSIIACASVFTAVALAYQGLHDGKQSG